MINLLTKKIHLFVITCACGLVLSAQGDIADLKTEHLSMGDCKDLRGQLKNESSRLPQFGVLQLLTLQINPGYYINLSQVKNDELISIGHISSQSNYRVDRNLSIFISKSNNDGQLNNYDNAKSEFLKNLNDFRSLIQDKISFLKESPTNEECEKISRERNITKGDLNSWLQSGSNLKRVSDIMWAHYFREKISDFFQFEEKVRVESTNGYQEILKFLELQDKSLTEGSLDVGLIFHSDSSGVLYDLSGYIVPASFFDKLSSLKSVKNIIIFSCYGQKVFEYYQSHFMVAERRNKTIYLTELTGSLSNYGITPSNGVVDFFKQYILSQKKIIPIPGQD